MTIATLITGGLAVGSRPATLIKGGLSSRRQLPEPPPSGYTQLVMGTPIALSPFTGLVSGDVLQYRSTTLDGGYSVTVPTNADVTISAAGDNSFQRILWNFWDASADELYFTSDATLGANDTAPSLTIPALATVYSQTNAAFGSFSLLNASGAEDFEGHAITVEAVTDMPPGGSITDGIVEGPFTTDGVYTVRYRFSDEYGQSTETDQTYVIGNRALPSVAGKNSDEALSILKNAHFTNIVLPGSGTISLQVPAAGTLVDPTLPVVLSLEIEAEEEPPPPPFVPPPVALKNQRRVSLRTFLLAE